MPLKYIGIFSEMQSIYLEKDLHVKVTYWQKFYMLLIKRKWRILTTGRRGEKKTKEDVKKEEKSEKILYEIMKKKKEREGERERKEKRKVRKKELNSSEFELS